MCVNIRTPPHLPIATPRGFFFIALLLPGAEVSFAPASSWRRSQTCLHHRRCVPGCCLLHALPSCRPAATIHLLRGVEREKAGERETGEVGSSTSQGSQPACRWMFAKRIDFACQRRLQLLQGSMAAPGRLWPWPALAGLLLRLAVVAMACPAVAAGRSWPWPALVGLPCCCRLAGRAVLLPPAREVRRLEEAANGSKGRAAGCSRRRGARR